MQKLNIGGKGRRALLRVMLTLIAFTLLIGIAAPQFLRHAEISRENHLRENLALLRTTIRQYRLDNGRYPASLQALVSAHYLRQIPKDPVIDRNDVWIVTAAPLTDVDGDLNSAGVTDVHSSAIGQGRGGMPYGRW